MTHTNIRRDVREYIWGIAYPITKDELVDWAMDYHAPEEVLAVMRALPRREYESEAEIMNALHDDLYETMVPSGKGDDRELGEMREWRW